MLTKTSARPDDTAVTMLQRADRHLYRAKQDGRDCWAVDAHTDNHTSVHRIPA